MLWRQIWIIWSSVHVPAAAVLAAHHDPIPFHDTPPRVMAAPAHLASTQTVSEPLQTHPTDRWEHTRPPTPVMPAHTRLASRAAARSTAWMKMVGDTQLNVTLSSQPVNCNSETHYISNNSINNKCCTIKWLHWSNLIGTNVNTDTVAVSTESLCLCLCFSLEIEMLVDDPKTCEDLHDLELNHELCIHITEDMLSAQNNGCSGMYIG